MTTYYLSSAGNDTTDGKSELNPWRNLARANQQVLVNGDSIRLRRGDTWTGFLMPKASGLSNLLIGDYANPSGPDPKIVGSGGPAALRLQGATNSTVKFINALAPNVAIGKAIAVERGSGNRVENCLADGGKSTLNVRGINAYMSSGIAIANCEARDCSYGVCIDIPKTWEEPTFKAKFTITGNHVSGCKYGTAGDCDGIKIATRMLYPAGDRRNLVDIGTGDISENDVEDWLEDAIDAIYTTVLKDGSDYMIRNNHLHGASSGSTDNQQGIKLRGDFMLISDNYIWGLPCAKANGIVALGGVVLIDGNHVANIGSAAGDAAQAGGYGILFSDGRRTTVHNNAVVDARIGIGHVEDVAGGPATVFSGNVVHGRERDFDIPTGATVETPNLGSRRS